MASRQPPQGGNDRIEWFTIRYRTLALTSLAILLAAGAGWLLLRPKAPPPPPPASLVATGATFTTIEGSVQVKFAGRLEWVDANRAMVLRQNDLVRTGPGSAAEIKFESGLVFSVRPDALFTIEESSQNPLSREQRVGLTIQSGEANFQTPGLGTAASTTISTPTVRATAERDTAGNVRVASSGATALRIFRGAGEARTQAGQKIALGSNEGLQVDAAGAAGAKTTLPTVPQLTGPPDKSELNFPDLPLGQTILTWSGVPGASAYRVMVDFSPAFTRPLYDRRGQRATQMELRGLDAGAYYWRVSALDASGSEGDFSERWRFSIGRTQAAAAPAPALSLETLEIKGNVLHVRGRTDPGATLSVNGEGLEVQPDGSFDEFLTFDGGATNILVRARNARGGVAEQRRRAVVVN
jgi:hypothetical protein